MKTIGLIGGTSWKSSMEYYKLLNEMVNEALGEYHSCKCIMYSVDFEEVQKYQHDGKWDKVADIMIDAAVRLEKGGADFILICANTLHKVSGEIEKRIGIPILHIADTTAQAIKSESITKVGLLGTKFTMEQDFYKGRLLQQHNIETIIPEQADIDIIHNVIFKELVFGTINEESRETYLQIIDKLMKSGAQGIVLGCTEIPLLINEEYCKVPIFDTTYLHVKQAVKLALE
jgi:aspartate racemase